MGATTVKHAFHIYLKAGHRRLTAGALAVALAFTVCQPAQAFDVADYLQTLEKNAAKGGSAISWSAVEEIGEDGAIISNVVITREETDDKLTIGKLKFNGADDSDGDNLFFETVEATDIRLVTDERKGNAAAIAAARFEARDFRFPIAGKKGLAWPIDLASGRVEKLRLVVSGEGRLALNAPLISLDGLKQTGEEGFTIDSVAYQAMVGSASGEDGTSAIFTIGQSEMNDFSHSGDGAFTLKDLKLGEILISGANKDNLAFGIDFDGLTATNIFSLDVSPTGEITFPEEEMVTELGGMKFSVDGEDLITLGGMVSHGGYDAAASTYSAKAAAKDLFIDVKNAPMGENGAGLKRLAELGYETLKLNYEVGVDWNHESGELNLSSLNLSADDAVALDLSMSVIGYTAQVAGKIQEKWRQLSEANEEDQQMLGMQLLAEASELGVQSIDVKIEDDSLTNRLLELQAEKSGQSKKTMEVAAPVLLGAMMGRWGIPDFAEAASEAIGSFMQSPGTLSISAKPDKPVSIAEIMVIATGLRAGNVEAQQFIDRFNVAIEAQ